MSYPQERKEAVLKKMLPPHKQSVAKLSRDEGISCATLYKWRDQARLGGQAVGESKDPEGWSTRDKFNAVVQCSVFNTHDVGEYCRQHGLLVEQVGRWQESCVNANDDFARTKRDWPRLDRKSRHEIKQLGTELTRKEKALAEAAALLVLSKKARAIWGEAGEE
jgi:transposase-like protein